MENSKILLYDGSFNGFLCCIYRGFEQSYSVADIRNCRDGQKALFADMMMVETEIDKAKRVWESIERKQYQAVKKIYFAFLSERKGIELLLYRYIRSLFHQTGNSDGEYPPAYLSRIEALAYSVDSEKRQVENHLNFIKKEGQPDLATLSPNSDLLPLLTRNLRARNQDRDWLVYDSKRHYGLYYHRQIKKCIRLSEEEIQQLFQNTSQLSPEKGQWTLPSLSLHPNPPQPGDKNSLAIQRRKRFIAQDSNAA